MVIYLARPEPVPVGANVDPLGLSPGARVFPEAVIVIVDKTVPGDVGAATVRVDTATGGAKLPTLPVMGNTLVVGSADEGLTPRLPISADPNGIPVPVLLAVVVDRDVVVGDDDAAMLFEPEPHIPDNPDVSSIPEVVDTPDVAAIAEDVDIPDDPDVPGDAMLPGVAPVLPLGSPPPS